MHNASRCTRPAHNLTTLAHSGRWLARSHGIATIECKYPANPTPARARCRPLLWSKSFFFFKVLTSRDGEGRSLGRSYPYLDSLTIGGSFDRVPGMEPGRHKGHLT